MKTQFLLVLTIGFVFALPQRGPPTSGSEAQAEVVSQDFNIEPDGSYQSSYATSNGIQGQETGSVKRTNNPESPEVIVVQGSNSYTSPEGQQISLTYSADDENGFVPQGSHLPQPPPIPPAIQKALDYLARVGAKK